MQRPDVSTRTVQRPDGTAGPALRRPWARWDVLAKGDTTAAILAAVATVLCAGALIWPHDPALDPGLFRMGAPLVGAVFFVALVTMFVARERHGIARSLLALGAVALAVIGLVSMGQVAATRVVVFYWVPAVLAMVATLALGRAKSVADHLEGQGHPRVK